MNGKIAIVDYGMGNLSSVHKKVQRLNAHPFVTSDPGELLTADKIILPGVGHFRKAMNNLEELKLLPILNEIVIDKKIPILGICLGMQLMARHSDEGNVNGIGWIDADIKHFSIRDKLSFKVPHMGWNQVKFMKESALLKGIPEFSEFYFVHSYHLIVNDQSVSLTETEYEYPFISAIEKENIYGVQYHPEKSHESGEKMLQNFIQI